jgi:hypothetical protein
MRGWILEQYLSFAGEIALIEWKYIESYSSPRTGNPRNKLAARKQRRTLSSFVEWAVDQALREVQVGNGTLAQQSNRLWDVEEPDRFVRLAAHHPDLLTFEEQQLLKALISSDILNPAYTPDYGWNVEAFEMVCPLLRDVWPELMRVRSSPSELRRWANDVRAEARAREEKARGSEEEQQVTKGAEEDEIPF